MEPRRQTQKALLTLKWLIWGNDTSRNKIWENKNVLSDIKCSFEQRNDEGSYSYLGEKNLDRIEQMWANMKWNMLEIQKSELILK